MPTLAQILAEQELKKLSSIKDHLPKYNDSFNARFNEIRNMLQQNRISGVLCRADGNGNLYEIVYDGNPYKPFLKNSKLYVASKELTYGIGDFITKIKIEQQALSKQAGSDVDYSQSENTSNY